MWYRASFCMRSGEPRQDLPLAQQMLYLPFVFSCKKHYLAILVTVSLVLCIIVLYLNAFVICLFEVDNVKHSLFWFFFFWPGLYLISQTYLLGLCFSHCKLSSNVWWVCDVQPVWTFLETLIFRNGLGNWKPSLWEVVVSRAFHVLIRVRFSWTQQKNG